MICEFVYKQFYQKLEAFTLHTSPIPAFTFAFFPSSNETQKTNIPFNRYFLHLLLSIILFVLHYGIHLNGMRSQSMWKSMREKAYCERVRVVRCSLKRWHTHTAKRNGNKKKRRKRIKDIIFSKSIRFTYVIPLL